MLTHQAVRGSVGGDRQRGKFSSLGRWKWKLRWSSNHGGSGSGLQLKKLKKNVVKTFGKALYEKRGIERIVVIDKKELFLQGGHKTAEVMSLPTK